MKRLTQISRLLAFAVILMVSATQVIAQSPQDVFTAISGAISKGSDVGLAAHFNSSVEVTLPGSDQSYTSTQAQFVVKDFFTKNVVKGFKLSHNGESGGTWYATGVYSSVTGSYDTNIFLKKVGDKYLITQIRFEQE